jgi:hypothetical protein
MTTAPTDLLVTDVIEAQIAKRMARYRRMPAHWEARRLEEMRAIEGLIDQLLALRGRDGEAAASHT